MSLEQSEFEGSRIGPELHPVPTGTLERHCRPLMNPDMVPASAADHMQDDDVVLGLELDGESRAYPWWIMDNHHVANDIVAGRAAVIVLCEVCSTGVAFDPIVNGERLTFEVGHAYNGTFALKDHQTESVWSPYLASAIVGPLEGTRLRAVPLSQMAWAAWRDLHPETRVLPDEPGARSGHGSWWTIGDPEMQEAARRMVLNWDTRLPPHTLVLGVVTPGAQRAYRLSTLRKRRGVINDELGGLPVVALLHLAKGSYGALAFSRVAHGRVLTFKRSANGIVDRETGSVWTTDGRAISGQLVGTELPFIESHVSKWYAWAAHYPSIEIA